MEENNSMNPENESQNTGAENPSNDAAEQSTGSNTNDVAGSSPYVNEEIEESAPVKEEPVAFKSRIDLTELSAAVEKIKSELRKVIIGQEEMIDLLIVSILANGHSLIEGVPGVAKTVTAKLLARTMQVGFSRIQFTPDLMPSDILGTSVFSMKDNDFEFKAGPIFSNIILIDEINRAILILMRKSLF